MRLSAHTSSVSRYIFDGAVPDETCLVERNKSHNLTLISFSVNLSVFEIVKLHGVKTI
jgi:hypothetical protein